MPRTRPLLTILCVALALAGGLWAAAQGPLAAGRALDRAISPGPLIELHAKEAEAQDCRACHELTGGIPAAKCLACHDEVAPARASETVHATFEGSCTDCHGDHGCRLAIDMDAETFNHARARYPLEGSHAKLECGACHLQATRSDPSQRRLRYAGLTYGLCVDCHDDPHTGQFPQRGCEACHAVDGDWKGEHLRFNHDTDSEFALDGAHTAVACGRCHDRAREGGQPAPSLAAAWMRGLPSLCVDCHRDPHEGQLEGAACFDCHTQRAWGGEELQFDHGRSSRFPLEAAHLRVRCGECHGRDARGNPSSLAASLLRGLPARCVDCHEDPHQAQFAADACARCHDATGWGGTALSFDHQRTRFPLSGSHAALQCRQCHARQPDGRPTFRLADAALRGVARDCVGCHDDPHAGSLEGACTACHNTTRWSGADLAFDHAKDSIFALDATHEAVRCDACHQGRRYRPTSTDCAGCHPDAARAMRGAIDGRRGLEPSPHRGLVSCAACHDPSDRSPRAEVHASRCGACHQEHYRRLFFARSELAGRLAREASKAGVDGARLERILGQTHHDFQAVKAALERLRDDAR